MFGDLTTFLIIIWWQKPVLFTHINSHVHVTEAALLQPPDWWGHYSDDTTKWVRQNTFCIHYSPDPYIRNVSYFIFWNVSAYFNVRYFGVRFVREASFNVPFNFLRPRRRKHRCCTLQYCLSWRINFIIITALWDC